jgi:hypothetical protein
MRNDVMRCKSCHANLVADLVSSSTCNDDTDVAVVTCGKCNTDHVCFAFFSVDPKPHHYSVVLPLQLGVADELRTV